jgi:hypothetical protein
MVIKLIIFEVTFSKSHPKTNIMARKQPIFEVTCEFMLLIA